MQIRIQQHHILLDSVLSELEMGVFNFVNQVIPHVLQQPRKHKHPWLLQCHHPREHPLTLMKRQLGLMQIDFAPLLTGLHRLKRVKGAVPVVEGKLLAMEKVSKLIQDKVAIAQCRFAGGNVFLLSLKLGPDM
jgi:hypothetical protein